MRFLYQLVLSIMFLALGNHSMQAMGKPLTKSIQQSTTTSTVSSQIIPKTQNTQVSTPTSTVTTNVAPPTVPKKPTLTVTKPTFTFNNSSLYTIRVRVAETSQSCLSGTGTGTLTGLGLILDNVTISSGDTADKIMETIFAKVKAILNDPQKKDPQKKCFLKTSDGKDVTAADLEYTYAAGGGGPITGGFSQIKERIKNGTCTLGQYAKDYYNYATTYNQWADAVNAYNALYDAKQPTIAHITEQLPPCIWVTMPKP